ncbi:hypothetical protein BEST7613_2781 [Synechocystis sp. PCC 6803]|nr:hypothetical protein BEST7613_2781 [Synechocystis sp. PCC 6803] [Bacillus subtilis BEST7613]
MGWNFIDIKGGRGRRQWGQWWSRKGRWLRRQGNGTSTGFTETNLGAKAVATISTKNGSSHR